MRIKIILILIFLTLPTLLPFFNSRFFYTQDYIFVARLNQMSAALADGQFPVRWAPDLRFGEPIFNFYAPLPYYIGALIHVLGFNFLWVAKILFILASILSAIAMYFFIRELFGEKAGVLASFLYTYAPYRAVDIYVRGSLSETWAFVFFPLIFYASLLVAKRANFKRIIFLALCFAGLFLTHNVTTLMFLPFWFLWVIYLIWYSRNLKIIASLLVAFLLGVSFSAFFILPALLERDLIQTKYLTVGYFNYRAHFVAVKQFFYPSWGYGSSLWGPDDGLSFQVGVVNWAVLLFFAILAVIKRKDKKLLGLFSVLGISFFLSIFLQHNKSALVWEALPIMAFIQFPWRFLAISVFIAAISGGAIAFYLKDKFKILYFVLIIASIVSTFSYFRPKEYTDDLFFDNFLNKEKMHQGIDLTKDYFPIWVKIDRVEYFDLPRAQKGEIQVLSLDKKSTLVKAQIKVLSDSLIEMPITFFPGWEVLANGNNIKLSEPSIQGLITFELPKGEYYVEAELKNTPVREIGNFISAFSIIGLILYGKFFKTT